MENMMEMMRKTKSNAMTLAVAAAISMGLSASASAQYSGDMVKIGYSTDMAGVYSDISGQGGVEAIKMAIADFGGNVNGKKIEFVYADHQSKPDVGANKVREWIDRDGVDLLMVGANSSVMLATSKVATDKKTIFIVPATGTSRLTNEECSPYTIHYGYDTVSAARGTGSAVTKQGGKTWYFLTADYVFGISLEADATKVVKENGGTVLGTSKHPLSTSDFASYMIQAQASKAQILGLANAGNDLVSAIKAANEFGVTKTMKLAGLLMFITDVHALGLELTKGMYTTDSWYWDQSPESRAWSKRYFAVMKRMPVSLHAATYSATMTYLKAVRAAGTDNSDKVLAQLKKTRVSDMYTTNATIRGDGRLMSDLKLIQVKNPADSKYPWDYYNIVKTIPAAEAFTTKAESKCALWQ